MENKSFEWNTADEEKSVPSLLKKNNSFKGKILFLPLCLALISTLIQILFLKSCSSLYPNNNITQKNAFVIAVKKINQGDLLTTENTEIAYLDLGESKSKFILNSEFHKFLGHKIRINIEEKTPILKNLVMSSETNSTLPEKIPHGKRFYAMEVDLNSLSSMIRVGDRVDIIAHMEIEGFGRATETILNGIKIIGIGSSFEERSSQPEANTLSFYLTPEEIKIISFMKPYSQFSIALRNPNDPDFSDNDSITFNKFLQNDKIQKIFQNDSFKIIEGKTLIKRSK